MKLEIQNIGKIERASIQIDGITLIGGENNTGKSTISKSLFSIFNSFFLLPDTIVKIKRNFIEHCSKNLYKAISTEFFLPSKREADKINDLSNIIFNSVDLLFKASNSVEFLKEVLTGFDDRFAILENSVLSDTIDDLKSKLSITDIKLREAIINASLKDEFNGQITSIYNNDSGSITLTTKNQEVKVEIKENDDSTDIQVDCPANFYYSTDSVYIDDPHVLDMIDFGFHIISNPLNSEHRQHLIKQLNAQVNAESVINIQETEKLKAIYEKISLVCSGDLIKENNNKNTYRRPNSDKSLNVQNLSTGLKTFVILKKLIMNGTIKEQSTIILDEPEIHLHPKWQISLAEIIVLLQKEFNLHILLNSHSPYFIRAIQAYSKKYSIEKKCRFYLALLENDKAVFNEVSSDIELIYEKLADPIQTLENVWWN